MSEQSDESQASAGKVERPVGRLDPSRLRDAFRNVEAVPGNRFSVYRVLDERGCEAGTLSHLGGHEWRAYVDNFPRAKKYFAWNLPALTIGQFAADVARTGLHLEPLNVRAKPPGGSA